MLDWQQEPLVSCSSINAVLCFCMGNATVSCHCLGLPCVSSKEILRQQLSAHATSRIDASAVRPSSRDSSASEGKTCAAIAELAVAERVKQLGDEGTVPS